MNMFFSPGTLLFSYWFGRHAGGWPRSYSWRLALNVRCVETWRSWASAEIFPGGATSRFYLSCSCCWRCNANERSQNALPFLHYNENAPCYGNSRKNRASLAQQCIFFIHASFQAVQNYEAYPYQQSLSRSIFCQGGCVFAERMRPKTTAQD